MPLLEKIHWLFDLVKPLSASNIHCASCLTGCIIIYFGLMRPWAFIALLTLLPSLPLQRSMWTESGRAFGSKLGKNCEDPSVV